MATSEASNEFISNAPPGYFNLRHRLERYIRSAVERIGRLTTNASTAIKTEKDNLMRTTRIEARAIVIRRHWRTRKLTDNQKAIVVFVDKVLNDNKALIDGIKKHGKNLLTIIVWGVLFSQYGLVGAGASLLTKIFCRGLQALVVADVMRTLARVPNTRF